jgi:hypothetical protein
MFVYMAATAIFVLSLRAAVVWVLALIVAAEVASRIVPGWKPQDFLAFQIFISALAVWGRNHLSAAIGKTGARTRAEAVRLADESGWLLGD